MIEVSMSTALLLYVICFGLGFAFMTIIYFFVDERENTYWDFFLFFTFSFLGALILMSRETFGRFIGVIVSNSLILLGYMMLAYGVRRIYSKKDYKIFYISLFILFFLSYLYATYINDNIFIRVYLINFASLIVLSYTLYTLVYKRKDNPGSEIMLLSVVLIIITALLRTGNFIINQEEVDQFLLFKNDPFFIVLIGVANLFVLPGILSIIKKRKESALYKSELSKASLVANLPGFVFSVHPNHVLTFAFVSSSFEDITGYDSKDLLEEPSLYERLVLETYAHDLKAMREKALITKDRLQLEYEIVKKDGTKTWVREQSIGIFDDRDTLISLEGYITDISTQKKLEKDLESMSRIDALTGLENRRSLIHNADRLWKQRILEDVCVSVFMIDIDDFKFYNDKHGHSFGDQILKDVGHALKAMIHRPLDIVSRYGGEEFVIVLYDCDYGGALLKSKEMHQQIKETAYAQEGKPLSISIGFVCLKSQGQEDFDQVLELADKQMYISKAKGKNQSNGIQI